MATARAMVESAPAGEDGNRRIVLTAPADGRVLRLFEPSERVVSAGAPLLEVGDPSRLEVVGDVLSTDAVALAAGTPMLADAGAAPPRRGDDLHEGVVTCPRPLRNLFVGAVTGAHGGAR